MHRLVHWILVLGSPIRKEDHPMPVRLMHPGEVPKVEAMMRDLWPDADDYDFRDETVFVWERSSGGLGGFISFSLRPWAEGCDCTPVPCM
jgi:hypothetical protein